MERKDVYEVMQNDIMKSDISETEKNKMLKNVMRLKDQKMNIMITGATGCGKSSTINAMFDTEVAKVGVGVDPETMDIRKYELDNLILWDTPGLGDGKEADNRHAKNIIDKLLETDENGDALIDLVLVILDGGTRDLGTSYELINNVIIPNLGEEKEKRILVAINQTDMAMKGRNWDCDKNEPNEQLITFLEDKVNSVKNRVFEATGVKIEPIYYSAGYKEEGGEQSRPYNLSKLLYYIINAIPSKKRAVYMNSINKNEEMCEDDDDLLDYNEVIGGGIFGNVLTKDAFESHDSDLARLKRITSKINKNKEMWEDDDDLLDYNEVIGGGIFGNVLTKDAFESHDSDLARLKRITSKINKKKEMWEDDDDLLDDDETDRISIWDIIFGGLFR